jgi:uncharacterized Zn finger protein
MPQNIEEAFKSAGADLFPARTADLRTDCSCPDWANPCKHVAATHFILGERFDEDPFLIFRLRGRTQEQILQALRLRRASQDEVDEDEEEPEEEPIVPLEEELGQFWNLREPLESVTISIHPAAIETPLLRRLGEPNFIPSPGLLSLLKPAYRAIGQAALKQAFDTGEEMEKE